VLEGLQCPVRMRLMIVITRLQKISGAFLKRLAGILSSPDSFVLAILFIKRLNFRNEATGCPKLSSLPIVL